MKAEIPNGYCGCGCGEKIKIGNRFIKTHNLAGYNRKYASKRMLENNPMFRDDVVRKMIKTKKANGTFNLKPVKHGGNGQPTPTPQKTLAAALGWPVEVPIGTVPHDIPTGQRKRYAFSRGWPTAYKIDIGNISMKIGIEVDGNSHSGRRRKLDNKKDECLKSLGWKIFRFKNNDVVNNLSRCVSLVMDYVNDIT